MLSVTDYHRFVSENVLRPFQRDIFDAVMETPRVGVLGARQALLGFMGHVPEKTEQGDVLSILNIGGVIGVGDSSSKDLGAPISVELIGQVVREGKPLNIKDFALPPCE